MLLHICLFIIVFLVILWYIIKGPSLYALRKIPGPPYLPILGNLHQVSSDTTKVLPILMAFKAKYGDIFQACLGFSKTGIMISDTTLLEILLGTTKELNKAEKYSFLHNWLGFGLLTAPEQKWKQQRKIITPAFHFKILEQFLSVFQRNDEIFVRKLEKELHGSSFDIYQYVTLLSLDNISETAMNTRINAQEEERSEFVESTRKMSLIVVRRQFFPLETLDFTYKFTKTYKMEKQHLKVLHGFTERVIRQRKALLDQQSEENVIEEHGIKNKIAFLDLLLRSTIDGRPLTQRELRDEVDTFMFEGHDTTASAISFTIYCLSKNPDVQQKVLEEIISVVGNDINRLPTFAELNELKYLEAVIKESLRLYPPVPVFSRQVQDQFEYDGIKIPKGISLNVFAYGIMRDAKHFPNPEKFDPERFLAERNFHPYAYIPFSAGPRNCIGQKFAMLEIKSTLTSLLRNFELFEATDCELILSSEVVLKGKNGINVRIKRRQI